ncbi:MAG: bifunctional diguanylate cyclase/phosphodiesterase [Pseudoxanthomonas suwonensis]|nr:bifunctional diguanylate cyclase/phosphodiesterase [Pseudoxanthomonas suwonensis]
MLLRRLRDAEASTALSDDVRGLLREARQALQQSSSTDGNRLVAGAHDATATADAPADRKDELQSHDPLTGLASRQTMLAALSQHMHGANVAPLALLHVDLDRFKQFNDRFGHAVGDQVLVEAAERLRHAVGDRGLCGRLCADEFLIIHAPGEGRLEPESLAEAVARVFDTPFCVAGQRLVVRAAIGMAQSPEAGRSPDALLESANLAMRHAKQRGDGAWQAFDEHSARLGRRCKHLDGLLAAALDDERLHLTFQPQVDMRVDRTVGAEALLRWNDADLGELETEALIRHLEENGDIIRIGDWALRTACAQAAAWRDLGFGQLRMAVNICARQLVEQDLAARVGEILSEFSLPGTALELELTERTLVEDTAATQRTFRALRQMGVTLAIDDFGEGHSSLDYLRRFPVNVLKIGSRFVRGLPQSSADLAICTAITRMAGDLGLGVIAEGVETPAQRDLLLQLGVTTAQGFLYAPGLDASAFSRRLHEERNARPR